MDNNSSLNNTTSQNFQPQKSGFFTFLKKNALLLCAILLVLFFFFILYLSATSTPSTTNSTSSQGHTTTIRPTTIPTQSPTPQPKKSLSEYDQAITWSSEHFSNLDVQNVPLSRTPQADGSIKYTYASLQPSRPNEITVKDTIVVAKRTVVTQKYIYNYTNTLEAPDYTFIGSKFYGPNTTTYVYLNKGIAFVADSDSTMVKEQLVFQPTSLEDFKQKYGGDIVSFTLVPTLPEE
jgi:hypothetical protein